MGGPEHSTLSNDAFPSREFDFHALQSALRQELGRPTWSAWGGKRDMRDPRFVIEHAGDPEYSLVTRSSDGQMLFPRQQALEDEAGYPPRQPDRPRYTTAVPFSPGTPARARATSAAGSSKTTGWRPSSPCPLNMFYNTGIATYIWVTQQPQAGASAGQGAVDRRHGMVPGRCARTWARRTASWASRIFSGSPRPSSPSRRANRARSSTTPPSGIGR